jgi:hypothetical protein
MARFCAVYSFLARAQRFRGSNASLSSSVANGTVFIPFGTIQETTNGAHGFLTAVDIDAWAVRTELNLTQSGSGPAPPGGMPDGFGRRRIAGRC